MLNAHKQPKKLYDTNFEEKISSESKTAFVAMFSKNDCKTFKLKVTKANFCK